MGSPADLTLRCRAPSPITVGNVFKTAPSSTDQVERVHILDEYLKALEDERRKIEAFKRELPHCMQLLDYAIEASREHLVDSPASSSPGRPFLSLAGKSSDTFGLFGKEIVEGFLKTRWESVRKEDSKEGGGEEKARRSSICSEGERPTWMAEAQLWSQPSFRSDHWKEKESSTKDSVRRKKDSAEQSTVTSPAFLFNSKQRPGGAFMPFVKEKPAASLVIRSQTGGTDFPLSSGESRPTTTHGFGAVESEVGSAEVSTRTKDVSADISPGKETVGRLNGGGNYSGGTGSTTSGGGNTQRKARRCWSPELHRRFVSALQHLGGSQIATPKQIRELMKVDGLTNDEVKSHLQKYRLHTQRPSPTLQAPQQAPPQLVVLGGIWVPPDYGNGGMFHDPSSCVSQQEPHYCQPALSQEFYSQLHPSTQIELHRSPSYSSPHGPLQSTSNLSSGAAHQTSGVTVYRGDSAGEDGKSESSSWKGENDSRGSSEKEEMSGKHDKDSGDEDEDDVDDADNKTDKGMRLQLEMSCSSGHSIKTEPH